VCSSSSISTTVTTGLELVYNTQWKFVTSNSQPKLRTYCTFKQQFCKENYTVMLNRKHRLAFTNLRISCHSLRIESGRHTSPKTSIEDRLCIYCDLNKIEDEYHFVMECGLYNNQRLHFLSDINNMFNCNDMSMNEIFLLIMSASDYDFLKVVTNFVQTCFDVRSGKV